MANLKDTIVLGNLTVTGQINGNIQSSGGTSGVFGSGTSGYLTKWIGSDTIANGPQIGTDTTKFLNNKGEWAAPPNTTYSAGTGLSLSGTTFSLNASTSNLSGYGNYLVKCSNSMSGWSDGPADLNGTWYKENSFMGSVSATDFGWQNIINIRHRGGGGEGDNSSYGMQIRSSLTSTNDRLYYRHQHNGTWYDWISVANLSDCKNPTDYYWANIKISSSSNSTTSPTFAEVYSEYGNFEWVGAMNGLYSNNLYMYDRSSDMHIGDPDYGDSTPNNMYLTAHDSIELNIRGCTIKFRQASGTVALTSDYWADVQLSGVSSTMTTPQFLRAKIGNAKRAVTCDPRTAVTSTGSTDLINNLPTGSSHLGLLTWDSESGFLGVDGDNAIICTPGDKGIFNTAGYLFILDEDSAFSNSSYKAYVDANGAWKTNSDIRLKTNINNYPSILEGIKQLDVITYTYIDQAQEKRNATETRLAEAQEILQRPLLSAKQAQEAEDTIKDCERILRRLDEKRNKMEIGLSAQQIEEKLPMPELFISKNPDEQLGYKYTLSEAKLVFAAIKAIQEQQTIIENQQKLIDKLTQEVVAIKAIVGRGDDNE